MIVALAGHVDHGKTSLVRALTGVETDRLPAEIERGLTIDLGFAYETIEGRRIGFVDVPGHHRFVHNMLAGISPAQTALLVVAADDGVMPQTREHLTILSLLGLTRGLIALTKCDVATDAQQASAREQINALTAGTFLEGIEPVAVASTTGDGIEALRQTLLEIPDSAAAAAERTVRLPVDRAFSRRGSGTIVTGTLRDGTLTVDHPVTVFPSGASGRVRSLHVDGSAAEHAAPGHRCAINIAGIDLDQVGRGSWLTTGAAPGCRQVVLDYTHLAERPLRHWTRVHVYHGTTHSLAAAALLDGGRVESGHRALLQLELDDPVLARYGDRVVLRDHGRELTLGGGRVIDVSNREGRRRAPARLKLLRLRRDEFNPGAQLAAELALGPVEREAFSAAHGLTVEEATALIDDSKALVIGDQLVAEPYLNTQFNAAKTTFDALWQINSTAEPIALERFLPPEPAPLRDAVLKHLLDSEIVARKGSGFVRPATEISLSPEEAKLLDVLRKHLTETPPPSIGDIAKRERLPLNRLRGTLKALAAKKQLVLLENNRALLPEQFQSLGELAIKLGDFTVKEFRDASGLGRNLVIDILEAMDARGFTRRNDNQRTVVQELDRLR
ncbi:MAG: selenocysteine-specific translation elongation factor [Pseudomonadota bacterium]